MSGGGPKCLPRYVCLVPRTGLRPRFSDLAPDHLRESFRGRGYAWGYWKHNKGYSQAPVEATPIPEPATITLLSIGVAAFLYRSTSTRAANVAVRYSINAGAFGSLACVAMSCSIQSSALFCLRNASTFCSRGT